MTSIHSWDFTVEVTPQSTLGVDTIRVGCVGVGSAGDKTFRRDEFHVGYYKHDPYSLVARQWFDDHPPAPKVWVVGNIVPRETKLDKWWVAAPVPGRGIQHWDGLPRLIEPGLVCRGDREILWIEP